MQLSGSRAIVKRLFITLSLLALLFATVKILAVPAQKISPPNSDYLFIIKKGSSFNDVIEKICIETALEMTKNNRAAAAEMLGLSRQSLYVKLRKFGLAFKD